MGKTVLIYSVKPESPDTDLNAVKAEIEKIEHFDTLEEKDFVFGMKQIFATFILPEGAKPDPVEEKLQSIAGVQGINQEACTLA